MPSFSIFLEDLNLKMEALRPLETPVTAHQQTRRDMSKTRIYSSTDVITWNLPCQIKFLDVKGTDFVSVMDFCIIRRRWEIQPSTCLLCKAINFTEVLITRIKERGKRLVYTYKQNFMKMSKLFGGKRCGRTRELKRSSYYALILQN